MTFTTTQLEQIATRLSTVRGVKAASSWTRVAGRERVYVDLTKHNGGRDWNGGVGHRLIIDTAGKVKLDTARDWAGAATYDWHDANDTLELVRAVVTEIGAAEQVAA